MDGINGIKYFKEKNTRTQNDKTLETFINNVLPLLPTVAAPNTAILTSDSEDFFRRIPLVAIIVFLFGTTHFYLELENLQFFQCFSNR